MTSFSELGLAAPILRALDEAGYTTPTPIQAQAIPLVMSGRDLLGIAQTGTGKTAAFSLPLLHRLANQGGRPPRGGCRALILSPTRELAAQIADNIKMYARHLGLSVGLIFGGVPVRPQIRMLSMGVDIIVATPGRLLDHLTERTCRLDFVETLVLDEADQMLDQGFFPAIRKVVSAIPGKRQTLFFSATMPTEIKRLSSELLNDPAEVSVTPVSSTAERVAQRVLHVEAGGKRVLLAELLRAEGVGRALVFARTKHGADRVVKHLDEAGIRSNAIHGDKSQGQRERALHAFRTGHAPILVATDIAARGIDVSGVTHVVQFDLPDTPESYVHRIGRTARAGASGEAVALCAPDEIDKLHAVEKLIQQQIPAEDHRADQSQPIRTRAPQQNRQGKGGRNRGRGGPPRQGQNGGGRSQGQGQGAPRPQGQHGNGPRPQGQQAGRGGAQRNANGGQPGGEGRRRRPEGAGNGGGGRDRSWREGDFRDSRAEPRRG